MRPRRWVPARFTRCSGSCAFSVPKLVAFFTIISVSPMMALSGVRSSWLTLETNCDLFSLASASWRFLSWISSNSRTFSIAIENVRLFDEIQDKNRQLAEASENKSQFVSSVSHELRTPLNAIIGLTEMMVKNATSFGTEKAHEPLQRVNRAGTHLLGLINQVLDLSKIEAGKLELNPQTVQLAPLIKDVIDTAGQLA